MQTVWPVGSAKKDAHWFGHFMDAFHTLQAASLAE